VCREFPSRICWEGVVTQEELREGEGGRRSEC